MEKIGLNQLRTLFRDFYVSKDHYPRKSFSLVPDKDKSLLIINSGMAPLKPYFAGLETPPARRMTTCQKCIRTGDLDNVGYTSRHGTFFEMMGSFSFGEYFKVESLTWGWEFITQVLKMPVDKLWASVYEDDDEAWDIWVKDIGIAPDRVVRLGKADNFWEIGVGPCGPCSEVYFDRGEQYGCDRPDCKPGCECDRYVEFWNHVFTQFNRDEEGNYTPLDHPNIDTGLGLERLACIMQDTDSIFDVDTIRAILDEVTAISDVPYGAGDAGADVSIRIVTDHIRSVAFMVADGILPSNEGRGYVLRRLLRRAAVHGKKLGIKHLFLSRLADIVIDVSGEEYEELREKQDYLRKIITVEEEKFAATIDQGQELLAQYIQDLKASKQTILSGEKVFRLYDTHGFHHELTKEILAEHGVGIDEEGFQAELRRQQETSRMHIRTADTEAWSEDDQILADLPPTVFLGYDLLEENCKVRRILIDGKVADEAAEGTQAAVVLEETPFYAESGGQMGDRGFFACDGTEVRIDHTGKIRNSYVHYGQVTVGTLKTGDVIRAVVDRKTRNLVRRNHSATHLLHQALRQRLGEHVQQAGSSVDAESLRFDFTHYEKISDRQLSEIEEAVNQVINEFLPVSTQLLTMDEAKEKGATALFDEKYGDIVRVVSMGDYSVELCGGAHVSNTGEVGGFHIRSESSVGSGTRRIEAATGTNLADHLAREEDRIARLATLMKTRPELLAERTEELLRETKEVRKELESLKKERMGDTLGDLLAGAVDAGGALLIRQVFEDMGTDEMRALTDQIRQREKNSVAVLISKAGGKVTIITAVSDALMEKGLHAGRLIKEIAAAAGGGGGGKADLAQAGAKDPGKIEAAMDAALEAVKGAL